MLSQLFRSDNLKDFINEIALFCEKFDKERKNK